MTNLASAISIANLAKNLRKLYTSNSRNLGEQQTQTKGITMKEIQSNPDLVAYCGLYCGACRSYLKGRCPGCHENEKAKWCKIRTCCMENEFVTCADCTEFADPDDCRKFNNLLAKLFGLVFRSDRRACVYEIREVGIDGYAQFMTDHKLQSIKRGKKAT
jgi:hypothetical protein